MVGGLWPAWLFWFFEALLCVSGKTKCAKCGLAKIFFVRWAFLIFLCWIVCLSEVGLVALGRPTIAANVSRLGEVADLEALTFNLALKFIRIPNVQFSTEPAILPNCC